PRRFAAASRTYSILKRTAQHSPQAGSGPAVARLARTKIPAAIRRVAIGPVKKRMPARSPRASRWGWSAVGGSRTPCRPSTRPRCALSPTGWSDPARGAGRAAEPRHRGTVSVVPLRDRSALRENILAVGCDPALGLLSAWLAERHPESRVIWLHAPSMAALGILAQGGAHVAG